MRRGQRWAVTLWPGMGSVLQDSFTSSGGYFVVYEVALSFAGEQRPYVERVALALQARGISVFYDKFEMIRLWGKDLGEELHEVYGQRSAYVVFFISKAWVEGAWPQHERRAALSRAIKERKDCLLPVRFDDTSVPGLSESIHYLHAEDYSPDELASMVRQKLGVSTYEGKASDVPAPRMTSLVGEVVFDYSSHGGFYVIGRGQVKFETKWSKANGVSIHVYNDPPSINGVALAPDDWTTIQQVTQAKSLDYTSRTRTPQEGQIVVLRNLHGFYAAIRLLSVKDDTWGEENDEVRFEYVIQDNGTDNFAC